MPGVPMVIGSHNHTIFLRGASQFCTELDTKEETVSRLIQRSFRRISVRALKQDNFHAGVEHGLLLSRAARPTIKFGAQFELSGKCAKKLARAEHAAPTKRVRRE